MNDRPAFDLGPFVVCADGGRAPKPRPLSTPAGLGDRLRTAAFAEWQAIAAFGWAAERFTDAPAALRADWKRLVKDEVRHYNLIRQRMADLEVDPQERPVSLFLWESLVGCTSGEEFCLRIAAAEERGRQAAVKLVAFLGAQDPDTAAVFEEIARDEVEHVALAATYYGWTPPV